MNTATPPIVISSLDCERIEALLESPQYRNFPGAAALRAEIERASILEPKDMPPDVVTMNSVVSVVDEGANERHQLTLVYPRESDGDPGKVSVLAPVGSAILGLRVGQTMQWPMPGGRVRTLRVDAIGYQPEAAGHLHR